LPRTSTQASEEESQQRRKARFLDLNKIAKPQSYEGWIKRQKKEQPASHIFDESVWYVQSNSLEYVYIWGFVNTNIPSVICLEVIVRKALVRALKCHHVFHQECLDGWFGRLHDYCPLCHRLIVSREAGPADEDEAERGSIDEETALVRGTDRSEGIENALPATT
jgi:hypothetical protein